MEITSTAYSLSSSVYAAFFSSTTPVLDNGKDAPKPDISKFRINDEAFSTYHRQHISKFNYDYEQLKKHDPKIIITLCMTSVSFLFSSTFGFTLLGFLGSGYLGSLLNARTKLANDYYQSLEQLQEDLYAIQKETKLPWQELLKDTQIQSIIKSLAPFVAKERLKLWQDEDLEETATFFGGKRFRSDLPRTFKKVLQQIDKDEAKNSRAYKMYGEHSNNSILAFVNDKLKESWNYVVPTVVTAVWQTTEPTNLRPG